MRIEVNIDPAAILRARGLGDSNEARVFLAEQVARLCEPYVPMAPGSGAHMKGRYTIAHDGSALTYHGPYAHYQYVGEVMVGARTGSAYAQSGEPKVGTGRDIQYSGGGQRGKEWEKRMMADRGDELKRAFANHIKRRKP